MAVQFTTLFSFNGYSNGSEPVAGLTTDANGNLFGTTEGGLGRPSTVFEIQNTGTVAAPIYASAPTTLALIEGDPKGGLTADANGNLFGTTTSGGGGYGTVFEMKNAGTVAAPVYTSGPTTLVSFDRLSNGEEPFAGLTADANGNLFGTTSQGGVGGDGTVFEIQNIGTVTAPAYASVPITLVSFNGPNGAYPSFGRLTVNANGDLFGTTQEGGANNKGMVFEIQNTGTVAAPVYARAPTTLVSFNDSNGANPIAGLTADANGDLFGATEAGGTYGYGTVFEIQNTGTVAAPVYASAPTTLVSFNDSNGANPIAGLTADANGDLFGTTEAGGTYGYGAVFETQNTGAVAAPVYASAPITLVSFNSSNGANPYAGLTADATGNLLGTTFSGGANGGGTVFEITALPTVSGTIGGQTTTLEAPVRPFVHATIRDANANVTETLTITLGGAGGTLADGTGFSSLTTVGSGVYRLSGTAAAITSELDALTFTPKAGAPKTSSTTAFTLSVQSSAGGGPAVDTTTTVMDKDIVPAVGGSLSSILWQNSSGQAAIWDMNGNNVVGGGTVSSNPGPSWHAIGTGDFYDNGHSDILWQNANGQAAIWEIDGTSITGGGTITSNPGPSWKAVGTGDFNDDGHSDILFQNASSGQVAIWEMNGTSISGGGTITSNPGPSWKAVGNGDFNDDGYSDILFQNASSGQVAIWEMNGSSIIGGGTVTSNPGASWKAIGTGDFNDDGHSDILWQNADGQVAIWEMNGDNVIGGGTVSANPGPSWHAIGTGGGGSDILFQNTSGQTAIWDMNGTNIVAGGIVSANAGPSWHAIIDFTLTATATSGQAIAVSPVAPTLAPVAEIGVEGSAIALDLGASAKNLAGDSNSLATLTISAIPVGATLSDGVNTFTATAGSTSVSVLEWSLSSLTITPLGDADFSLSVSATQMDSQGRLSAATTATEAIAVSPVAPTLAPVAETGVEGSAIALDLGASAKNLAGDSNSLATLTISAIPVGATLSDGVNTFTATAGSTSVSVLGWSLSSLTITPLGDADFSLSVSATQMDSQGRLSAATTATEAIAVSPAAPPSWTVIESSGSMSLLTDGTNYFLQPADGPAVELSYHGAPVTAGEFAQYGYDAPIAAAQTASGYEVAWKTPSGDQYQIWTTDSSGNYLSSPYLGSGSSAQLESYEASFNEDLNGDGTIGVNVSPPPPSWTVIESSGSMSLLTDGTNYFLQPADGPAVELSYHGAPVTAGEFAQYGYDAPIAAAQTASGYEVAWKTPSGDQYQIWTTDSSGNELSIFEGSGTQVESYEASFNDDLNGDGTIGVPPPPVRTVIESSGSMSLLTDGTNYFLQPNGGSAVELSYGGAPVTAGEFAQYGYDAPIAAAQTASGYEVAWKTTSGGDQYQIWTTDSSGNELSIFEGSGTQVESYEASFNDDLNGDGTIGVPPPPVRTVIESSGSMSLLTDGTNYFLQPNGGSAVELSYGGAPVTAGEFAQYGYDAPIAAAQTASGYEVAWKTTSGDQYQIWTTDSSGNEVSIPFGGSGTQVESYETSFNDDLNDDGTIGVNASPPPQFVYEGTDASGAQVYDIANAVGLAPLAVRVLTPQHPSTDYQHSFLYALPVGAGVAQDGFGNGLDELENLDVENQYNATIIEPIFPIDSWYADNPNNPTINYETFVADILPQWVDSNFSTTGTEQNLLIGFSKSGYGALDLELKHPSVFSAVAAFDFPGDMTSYDDYGSSSADDYGTQANFQNNYEMNASFVGAHAAPFTTSDRILISEGPAFQSQAADFDALLTSQGVMHTLSTTETGDAHNWTSGWVSTAVAGLFGLEKNLHSGAGA